MKTLFGWMLTGLVLLSIAAVAWTHIRHDADSVELMAAPVAKQAQEAEHRYAEAQDAQQTASVRGPFSSSMKSNSNSQTEDIESIEYRPVASDHVGGSVVGTSNTILQKTFAVAGAMQLPFQVPAHAYNPQLHGTFRSFLQGGKPEMDADKANVEFLLLNDQEYNDLVSGHPSDAVFSAEDAHDQEVNANLPPTLDKPMTYHLVFRNSAHIGPKKLVQADFRMDY
jgi:hypothetical protein